MQIPSSSRKPFDRKNVETILKTENKFITDLLNILPLPSHSTFEDDVLLQNSSHAGERPKLPNKQTSRAKSLVELQERINQMTAKKGLTYKEKLLKKNLKAKLKKKNKKNKSFPKVDHSKSEKVKTESEHTKPELNNDLPLGPNNMEFSKIDFSNLGTKKKKKEKKDPEKMLQDIKKHKTKLEELRESGEIEQASKMREKQAWKNALARADGQKVKDDEHLLAKSIKKNLQKRKQSKKKWESRIETVKKAQEDRQTKRQENIDKRKKTKKVNKMKKAVKRGKIIPGF